MKTHHIGYLVKDIQKAALAFEKLGYARTSPNVKDDIRQVIICFMWKGGAEAVIELVQPANEDSPIYGLLKRFKNAPYHICYEVECLDEAIAMLSKEDFILIRPPEIAPAINNQLVAFLNNSSIGIIELLQTGGNKCLILN